MKLLLQYWKTIIWAVIIFVLSTMSMKDTGAEKLFYFEHMDKVVHFTFYSVLSLFIIFDHLKTKKITINFYLITFTFCIVYGGVIELLQGSVFADRSTDILDFLANSTGALIGCLMYYPLRNFKLLKI